MNAFSLLLLVATLVSASPSSHRPTYDGPAGYDNRPSPSYNKGYEGRNRYDAPSTYNDNNRGYQPNRSEKYDQKRPVIIDHGGLPPPPSPDAPDHQDEPILIDHGGLTPLEPQDGAEFQPDASQPAPAPVVLREKPFRIRDRIAFKFGKAFGKIRAVPLLIKNATGKALKSIGNLFQRAGSKLHQPNYWATCELKVFTRYMKLWEYQRAVGVREDRMMDYFYEGEEKAYLSLKSWATAPENKKIYEKRRKEAYKKYGKDLNHETGY